MTDQIRISDTGELEIDRGPLTWDGEPLYSVDTGQEGLFSAEPFAQMPGQTNWTLVVCSCCRQDFFTDPDNRESYCPRCMELGGELCVSRRPDFIEHNR